MHWESKLPHQRSLIKDVHQVTGVGPSPAAGNARLIDPKHFKRHTAVLGLLSQPSRATRDEVHSSGVLDKVTMEEEEEVKVKGSSGSFPDQKDANV